MKRFLLIVSILSTCFLLTACKLQSVDELNSPSTQSIVVYDAADKQVMTLHDQAIVEKFSEYASQDSVDVDSVELFDQVPEDAQLAYRFVLKEKSNQEINMKIFANYDYLLIEDLPILGDLRLKLTKEEADWFRNPEDW